MQKTNQICEALNEIATRIEITGSAWVVGDSCERAMLVAIPFND